MKKLKCTGRYKDGGSTSWIHLSSGEKYWLNNKINDLNKGKLLIGNINDKNPKLAIGHFCLNMDKKPDLYIFQ